MKDYAMFREVKTRKLFIYGHWFFTTYVSDEIDNPTTFCYPILETGWIHERDVYLVTDNHSIGAKHFGRAYLYVDPTQIYSFFIAEYAYKHPAKNMESHWKYRIGNTVTYTSSLYFDVELL